MLSLLPHAILAIDRGNNEYWPHALIASSCTHEAPPDIFLLQAPSPIYVISHAPCLRQVAPTPQSQSGQRIFYSYSDLLESGTTLCFSLVANKTHNPKPNHAEVKLPPNIVSVLLNRLFHIFWKLRMFLLTEKARALGGGRYKVSL